MVTGLDDEVLGRVAEQLGNKFFRAGLLLGIPPHDLDTIQVCVLFIYVIHSSSLNCLDGLFESGAVYIVVKSSCIPDNLFSGFKGQPSIDANFSSNISEVIEACLHEDLNSGPNPD